MTVLMPENCWNNCNRTPNNKALLTAVFRNMFKRRLQPVNILSRVCNVGTLRQMLRKWLARIGLWNTRCSRMCRIEKWEKRLTRKCVHGLVGDVIVKFHTKWSWFAWLLALIALSMSIIGQMIVAWLTLILKITSIHADAEWNHGPQSPDFFYVEWCQMGKSIADT